MNIHIFTEESLYSKVLLQNYFKYINYDNHIFIFRKQKPKYRVEGSTLVDKLEFFDNIFTLIFKLLPLALKANWVYIHYLPYGPSLLMYWLFPKISKKATWIIWGGDVYIYRKKANTLYSKFYESLRKKVIPIFPEIASFIEFDALEAKRVYNSNALYFKILYPLPIELNDFSRTSAPNINENITILLGNSADPSNNHIEALKILSRFNSQRIKIICPLSYYSDKDYIESVIKFGNAIFENKFIPLLDLLGANEYSVLLQSIDIAIMNHDRQQALGNIIPLLYLGKKVFLKESVSTFDYFRSANCVIYRIESIYTLSFDEFIAIDQKTKDENSMNIYEISSTGYSMQLWKNLLNRHSDD
ncbi:MAG: TDP-N-acetylfucosamine:lipid II N-acetylfucosaminyltransferase [Bacteroidales bacterium]|nr:TDP-N-acetylfucosamine:lipid II N-acetylfucosaminyltransferase [Bacteroidales bacterium]